MDDMDLKKLDQVFRQQVHHCQELMKAGKCQDDLVLKALRASRAAVTLLQRFTGSDDDTNKKDDEDLRLALHNYTRSVLDSTYFQECALTGVEFQANSPYHQIAAINKALSMPPRLCGSPNKVGEVLGTELVECVYWRVGALLYMFCHSMYEGRKEKRANLDKDIFLECCRAGVGHLRLMLSARTPLGENDDYVSYDADMVQLLKQGIFSDIHMLSLMYAGEMCFWAWEVTSTIQQPSNQQHYEESSHEVSSVPGLRTKQVISEVSSTDSSVLNESNTREVKEPPGSEEVPVEAGAANELNGQSADVIDDLCVDVGEVSVRDEKQELDVDLSCGTNGQNLSGKQMSTDSRRIEKVKPVGASEGIVIAGASSVVRVTGLSGLTKMSEKSDVVASSSPNRKSFECCGTEGVTLYNVMLHTRGQTVVDSWNKDFDALKHGVEMLSKYISVARGPLKKHGWNYSKAVELMVKLKKANMRRN